jgi:putrescine transport system substrate-binding protein
MRRLFWCMSALAALIACAGPLDAQTKKDRIVNVYNWSDYIDPAVIEDFTKTTGIKVRYDTFDSNDTLETKLLTGKSGYDVVVPTAYFLERQIKAGVFQKFDKAKLTNIGNVWPEIAARLATYDPGNLYAVNYMWGTTGIGYSVKKLREILGPDAKIDSWDAVFKPENLAKFKACGVMMLDSSDDILTAALRYLSLDPNTKDQSDLVKAADLVAKAQKRGVEAKSGIDIGYAIPKEGAQMWFDNFAIPKDAKNVEEAHEFINFMLRPEAAARNSNFVSYANGNLASQKLIDKAILEDKTVYPDEATMKTLYTIVAHDQKTQRAMNRLWTKIKTGR